ncbi:CAPA peptides isoform X1 [Andrena cerasifolii]|uniref:CAPA peptides isoform X1 n=1 Tax=Andrena cerasifolii TaxID=2819439 RepID=UPI004037FE62
MRDHLFVFLVVLIFSTSLNQGQKVKANNRRASGLVPYPRIGRNSEMVNFARSDRAAGLLHYPRVGRSDLPISNVNFNGDMEPDQDFQFYNEHDAGLDLPVDLDYEGFMERAMKPKHAEKTLKDPSWLIPNRLHLLKDYRPWQKIDDSKSLYPNARGSRNNQLTPNDYTPRLGREIDVERPFCK